MKPLLAVVLILLAAMVARPSGALAESKPNCAVDENSPPDTAAMLVERGGEQYVSSRYLSCAEFNSYGLTWLDLGPGTFAYADRKGRIVIRDVAMMDAMADQFHHGLVRLKRGDKYGFADPRGRIVVPIRYDGAMNSDERGPQVCMGCRNERDEGTEHHFFTGGRWFDVNAGGRLHEIPAPQ